MEFEKHTGIFSTSGDLASALSTGAINKPYMAIVGNELDWNSQEVTPPIDYRHMPLTFEIISGGTIMFQPDFAAKSRQDFLKTIYYSFDGGESYNTISAGYSKAAVPNLNTGFSVNAGDIVTLWGNNDGFSWRDYQYISKLSGSTAVYKAYGNILSLIGGNNPDDFANISAYTTDCVFLNFFKGEKITDASNLILPTFTRTKCYYGMFQNCSLLSGITCLATDISAADCTKNWLSGVAASGTFYKHPDMPVGEGGWSRGPSGIPDGWTVVDYTQ